MGGTDDALGERALDILWREARTYNRWCDRDVPETLLHDLYDLLKLAPTGANCCPARFVFLKTPEAKARLKPFLDKGNVDKTMSAPVTALVGYDPKFYDYLPELFPHAANARGWYADDAEKAGKVAVLNGSLQGAYLILAARSLGLDCGPMGGFDAEGVRKEFFDETGFIPNFLCNIGYGTPEGMHPRLPRLSFDTACRIL